MATIDPYINEKVNQLKKSLGAMDHEALAAFTTAIISYIYMAHPLVWLETDAAIRSLIESLPAPKGDDLPEFKA